MSFDQSQRRPTFVLNFDEQFPGLEVHFRRPGYRPLKTLAGAVLVLGDDLEGRGLSGDAKLDAFEPLFTAMASCVRRWNLVDEGRAVPLTELLDQDWEFLLVLAKAWYREVVPARRDRPRAVDYAQAVDSPVDNPEAGPDPATEGLKLGAPGPLDPSAPSSWGEPGTDEEWLGQFAMHDMPPEPERPAQVPDAPPLDEYEGRSKADLAAEAESRDLPSTGTRAEILERLRADDSSAFVPEPDPAEVP